MSASLTKYWFLDRVYDMSEVGGPVVRCVGHKSIPIGPTGEYLIPAVRCGYIDQGGPPSIETYLSYLKNYTADAFLVPSTSREVRMLVKEEDWVRVTQQENEFGPVCP